MDKLTLKTKELAQENIAKLSALFPEIITEVEKGGKIIKTINSDKLKELVGDYADNSDEFYELSWVGKQKSRQKIVMPINKTLRPVVEDSIDFENTENLYIEGDNFEVLKLLQESYLNKIKMIYIDPPYNTGKDFVYKDTFSMSREKYDDETGAVDEEGNKLFKNTTTNGRFHSDWLSMMFERLVIAKDLLRDDGIIFISIDDNEVANLRKICDEVFGEDNFVAQFIWKRRSGSNDALKNVSLDHEYVLSYSKNSDILLTGIIKCVNRYQNPDNDPQGAWARDNLTCGKTASERPNLFYPLVDPETGISYECNPTHVWRFEKQKMDELIQQKKVIFPKNKNGKPNYKRHLSELRSDTKPISSIISTVLNSTATRETREILEGQFFNYPKSIDLMKQFINQGLNNTDVILDFFSGSATTAHAVMQLNAEDGGNRKFIMVQLPEPTAEDSEAFKAGYANICEIGKERIRRAARKIQDELKDNQKQQTLDETGKDTSKLDFGFRVFRTDSSNMKGVYYNPKDIDQRTLTNFRDNIKEDRTDKDLLYQILLELAIPISAKIKEEKANNKTIYRVNNNFLIACFDDDVDLETIKKIAELNPSRIVFKDSSFKDDAAKVNCGEYLKNKLPSTIVKVI